jgi:hypothetical protein
MKIKFTIIFLFIVIAAANGAAAATVQGQLLRSSGKFLPYVEIELVPEHSIEIVIDRRLNAISSFTGKFSFMDVPDGNYTLSVNFGDKPTDLSPYPEYFYPGTYKRGEAQVFQVTRASKFAPITFRLPPPLTERKIAGQVLFPNGTPVKGAYLTLIDIAYDNSIAFVLGKGGIKTDAAGNFSVKGFDGRRYQIGGILFEENMELSESSDPIAAGESDVFTLDPKTPVIKFELKKTGNLYRLKEKYLGMTVFKDRETLLSKLF